MNDDDGEPKASVRTQYRAAPPPMNLYTGVPAFSNPFTKIALESSYPSSSPSRAPNSRTTFRQNMEVPGKTEADNVGSSRVRFESPTKIQTPQKRPVRPFQPLSGNSNSNSKARGETASSLSPYVNFLKGSKSSSSNPALLTPMSATRDENVPDLVSLGPGYSTALASTTAPPNDIVFEKFKDVYTSLAEKTKQESENQIITLRNALNQITKEREVTKDELNQTKFKLDEASLEISNLNSLIENNEVGFKGKIQDLNDVVMVKTAEKDKLSKELEERKREMEEVKALLRLEVSKGDAMRAKVDETKEKISNLATVFDGLEKGMQEFGGCQLAYRKLVDRTAQELTELRRFSAETAGRISEHGEKRQLLGQARVTLAELKEELTDSQRVNDLLRDKLHSTSAQLAEVTGRLRELEDEKREIWGDTLQRVARHVELQESVIASEKELVGKFRAFEEKNLQLCGRSAELEAKLVEINKRNQEMEAELVVLRPLQQEKLRLRAEVLDLSQRLADETLSRKKIQSQLEEAKDALISAEKESLVAKTQIQDVLDSRREVAAELSNLRIAHKELESNFASFREKSSAKEKEAQVQCEDKLSAVQEVLIKRDQEIIAFQTKFTLGEDMRDQLRATLLREQATTSRLQQELKETTIREAIAMGKVDLLEGRTVNLNRELENKEDIIRQLNCKVTSAQDRFEAQASTLRLTKEELGDMQEKMTNLIVCHETALGKLRLENAVTQEQKSSLSLANEKLFAEMKAQDNFAKKFKELQVTIDGLENNVKEKEKSIFAADRELTNAKKREEELKAKVIQLESALERVNKEKKEELGKLRTHETDRILALEGQIAMSMKEIVDLKKEKEELVASRNTLLERYAIGDLSDVEKDFTSVLLENARDLHEQASVAKDNEMKRRDKTILGLQERNAELESMLAQMLQPADMDPSLLLNSKTLSPSLQGAAHALPQPQPPREQLPNVAVAAVTQASEMDIVPPIPSQIPSELSTPPQSPRPSRLRVSTISFVQLSNEDSEKDEHQPEKVPSLKRFGEDEPEADTGATKKRLRVGVSKKVANQEGSKVPEARGRGRPKKSKIIR